MNKLPSITAIDNYIKFYKGDIIELDRLYKLVLGIYNETKENLKKRVDEILKFMVESEMIIIKNNLIIKKDIK